MGGSSASDNAVKTAKINAKAAAEAAKVTAAATLEAQQLASESAEKIHMENLAFQEAELVFQREQYADWQGVYGDLQQNLGDYYNNMTTSSVTTQGLVAEATEYQRALTNVSAQMESRGMGGTGAEAAAITALGGQSATQRATIRGTADQHVAQQQAGFLGMGINQGTTMLNTQAGIAQSIGGMNTNYANTVYQGGMDQANTIYQGGTAAANAMYQGGAQAAEFMQATAQQQASAKYGYTMKGVDIFGNVAGGYLAGSSR